MHANRSTARLPPTGRTRVRVTLKERHTKPQPLDSLSARACRAQQKFFLKTLISSSEGSVAPDLARGAPARDRRPRQHLIAPLVSRHRRRGGDPGRSDPGGAGVVRPQGRHERDRRRSVRAARPARDARRARRERGRPALRAHPRPAQYLGERDAAGLERRRGRLPHHLRRRLCRAHARLGRQRPPAPPLRRVWGRRQRRHRDPDRPHGGRPDARHHRPQWSRRHLAAADHHERRPYRHRHRGGNGGGLAHQTRRRSRVRRARARDWPRRAQRLRRVAQRPAGVGRPVGQHRSRCAPDARGGSAAVRGRNHGRRPLRDRRRQHSRARFIHAAQRARRHHEQRARCHRRAGTRRGARSR